MKDTKATKDVQERRKAMRLLRMEQTWLRGKMTEFRASIASNKGKLEQLEKEIQKSKPK